MIAGRGNDGSIVTSSMRCQCLGASAIIAERLPASQRLAPMSFLIYCHVFKCGTLNLTIIVAVCAPLCRSCVLVKETGSLMRLPVPSPIPMIIGIGAGVSGMIATSLLHVLSHPYLESR
jgi:hypothetical protein